MIELPLCRHIKTNGLQCRAVALAEASFCYFHHRLHARQTNYRPNDLTRPYFEVGRDIELGAIEDRESVQFALSVVINAIATNRIDTRRATALLYGLQLASYNAVNINIAPDTPDVVRTMESRPDGLDLAEPGAVIEVYERLEHTQSLNAPKTPTRALEAETQPLTPASITQDLDLAEIDSPARAAVTS
jgi:hypothetical protein